MPINFKHNINNNKRKVLLIVRKAKSKNTIQLTTWDIIRPNIDNIVYRYSIDWNNNNRRMANEQQWRMVRTRIENKTSVQLYCANSDNA